jgi:hypothetical protein
MVFPAVDTELEIDGTAFRIAEHPSAPGLPYGQEGRQAVVYQLVAGGAYCALKVFKTRYRLPSLVYLSEQLEQFADLPGLAVCRRSVLTPQRHPALLRQHPDLTYAVLMPWITGPTWMQVLIQKKEFTPEQSLELARSLANVVAIMEQRGLAHCDLSGTNVMLPVLAGDKGIALVDVEQMYGPELRRPSALPGGSPGYAHKVAPEGLWAEAADRFSGAILFAEMLTWCDERIRAAAWGESYFEPQEMQRDTQRYDLLRTVLSDLWGEDIARLFERAWHSDTLTECATAGEWLAVLPDSMAAVSRQKHRAPAAAKGSPPASDTIHTLMALGHDLVEQSRVSEALEAYRSAQRLAPQGSGVAQELGLIIADLQEKRQVLKGAPADAELESLFAQGLAACDSQRWAQAEELLAEVVRRRPEYARRGQGAAALLEEVRSKQGRARRWWPAPLILAGTCILALLAGVAGRGPLGWLFATPTATLTATVTPRPTLTAIPTWTVAPSAVATSTPVPTHTEPATPTENLGATATAEAAQTARAEAAAAETVQAHSTATERAYATAKAKTPTLAPAPVLDSPANGASLSGDTIAFGWRWDGQLMQDEHFDVRVWKQGTQWKGVAWTESQHYDAVDLSSGTYSWSIVVLRQTGTNPDGSKAWVAVSEESQVRWFAYSAPPQGPGATTRPPPTNPPPTPATNPTPVPYP